MTIQKPNTRISKRFKLLQSQKRAGLITFLTAGDPNIDIALDILKKLPNAGADLIEIGMPFSDPMADGPAIQASSIRSLNKGMTLKKTIEMVEEFRKLDADTPIVLMGYYNPIYIYGVEKFLTEAKIAGVDGLIIVDLPPEEEEELCLPALRSQIDFIYLTTPTTNNNRLPKVLKNASGFIYYVSITGITGTSAASIDDVRHHVDRIRNKSNLPIAVGFGIRSPEQVKNVADFADAVVVSSALVDIIKANLDENDEPDPHLSEKVIKLVKDLANSLHGLAK